MKKLILIASVFLCSCSSENDFNTGKRQLEQKTVTQLRVAFALTF